MDTIQVFDATRQDIALRSAIHEVFSQVLSRGIFVLGKEVSAFEASFARYIGSRYAIGVASGTDAISLALLSLGVQTGDEVILPANSYPSVFGVTAVGAIPRLVDIDPKTYTMDPSLLSDVITKKTKAIIPVHLYGRPAPIQAILDIAQRANIPVIEDCAQAAGAYVMDGKKKKKVGAWGDVGCFSFYPTKNLGCLGDGGMVVTNDPDIADRVRRLRMYGEKERYVSTMVGRNSRLDEIQAAFLRVKLPHLDAWNEKRRAIAHSYLSCFGVGSPHDIGHIYHLFVIRSRHRDACRSYLEQHHVGSGIHYPTPIHLVPSLSWVGYKKGDFPQSEIACAEIFSLPLYPELSDKEISHVCACLTSYQKESGDTLSV